MFFDEQQKQRGEIAKNSCCAFWYATKNEKMEKNKMKFLRWSRPRALQHLLGLFSCWHFFSQLFFVAIQLSYYGNRTPLFWASLCGCGQQMQFFYCFMLWFIRIYLTYVVVCYKPGYDECCYAFPFFFFYAIDSLNVSKHMVCCTVGILSFVLFINKKKTFENVSIYFSRQKC